MLALFSIDAYSYDRVVSLAPSITDMVGFVGADRKLIADTVYHKDNKVKIGGMVNPNIEIIASLHPDLVISTTVTPQRFLNRLKAFHIKVVRLRLVSIDDIENAIEIIGNLLSSNGQMKKIAFQKELGIKLKKLKPCLENKSVLVVFSINPIYIAGRDSYLGQVLTMAGARYPFNGTFLSVSAEGFLHRKYDVVIVACARSMALSVDRFLSRFHIRYINVDPNFYLHPGPVLLKAIDNLGDKICN